jgi:hypothetical protein
LARRLRLARVFSALQNLPHAAAASLVFLWKNFRVATRRRRAGKPLYCNAAKPNHLEVVSKSTDFYKTT